MAVVTARIAIEEAHRPVAWIHVAAAVGAVAVVLLGYATRRWWLALPAPVLPVAEIPAWQRLLDELEQGAQSGTPQPRSAPGGVRVAVTIDRVDGGWLHAYSLSGEDGPMDERRAIAAAGMALQRLPRHQVVRAGFGGDAFHVWALVAESASERGSRLGDPPRLVRDRALAFARSLRLVPPLAVLPDPAVSGGDTDSASYPRLLS